MTDENAQKKESWTVFYMVMGMQLVVYLTILAWVLFVPISCFRK